MDMDMAEAQIKDLKETVQRQQKLLHKLYSELDAERESSSTAATEAMSMILRLQEEKAAEMLQATQFKRLIQEKMDHATQILRHKDFQIASLEFQLQAYRYKMLSLGLSHQDIQDMEFATTSIPNVRRIQSLPAIQFKQLIPSSEIHQDQDAINIVSEDSAIPDLTSYWEQIKELDQKVEKVIGVASSLSSLKSDPKLPSLSTDPDKLLPLDHSTVPCSESSQSLSMYDVFEVPQNHEETKLCQGGNNLDLDKENRLGKPDQGLPKDAGWIKSLLQYAEDEHKWTNLDKGISVQSHMALADSTNCIFPPQTHFQQLSQRVGKFEENRVIPKQGAPDHGEINSRLLKEIQEQLNSIQSEIRREKSETCPVANEPSVVSLMEEMFFYSL